MILSERYVMKYDPHVITWCNQSRLVYNRVQYMIWTELQRCNLVKHGNDVFVFDFANKFSYTGLWHQFKTTETHERAKQIMTVTCIQQTIRQVVKNWRSFFRARKEYKTAPDKFSGRPMPPRYCTAKYRNRRLYPVFFHKQDVRIKNGVVHLPKSLDFTVKIGNADTTKAKGARILPKNFGFIFEFLYEVEEEEKKSNHPARVAAIDLGVCNLATVVSNTDQRPLIYPGGRLKALNQYYNKKRAKLQDRLSRADLKTGNKLRKLDQIRDRKIEDIFHKVSRSIIDWCVRNDIDTLVIGKNKGWKQKNGMGKQNHQNFVYIPHNRFVAKLKYKARLAGIGILIVSERYTSKCSFLDNEAVRSHDVYAGRRISRELFRSADGTKSELFRRTFIHADVNAAANIGRTAVGSDLFNKKTVFFFNPKKVDVSNSHVHPEGPGVHSHHLHSQQASLQRCCNDRGVVAMPIVGQTN